jgi:hypothetical protein
MKMGRIVFPKTTVRNYHYALINNSEESSFHLLCDRNLKSGKIEDISKNR